ncbi:alcohol dehydrogenase catalytic domain-containing protein, partial [Anaerococcus lactolyticus]|uniref:alcohol dehydrogenase catalytic domain-containing protein n=1 Tax=Anaerococcus lactolyticus TaxID=33032 RepID=UPI001B7F7EE1
MSRTRIFAAGFIPCRAQRFGNEASGVVQAVGAGVEGLKAGDRITYTGFTNTLGAYSTERLLPAAAAIRLP